MLMFSFIAQGLLQDSLDYWFKGQYSIAMKNSATMIDNLNRSENNELKSFAKTLAQDYSGVVGIQKPGNDVTEVSHWLIETLDRFQLDGIVMYDASLRSVEAHFVDKKKEMIWNPVSRARVDSVSGEFPLAIVSDNENGRVYRALTPIQIDKEEFYLEISRIIFGSEFNNLVKMEENLNDFRNLMVLENPIRTNFSTYLILFSVLIIFGSSWFVYYLAGSIVEPIKTLVGGTRRIAKGDLDFQIELQVDDEIGMLLDSFNAMTKELQQSQKRLADSKEDLLEANKALEGRNIFVELVLQNIQTGVFSIDNFGYVNGINPYMIKLFKITSSEVTQKHYLSVLTKEQAGYFEELNSEITRTGQTSAKKDVHLRSDKRTIHVSMELFQLKNQKGELLGRLLVVDNLTDIDRSTRASAWREVARRIAHEIKNPLTPIQLSTQRIRRKYIDSIKDPEMLDNCTSIIIKEVNGLKKMVNEFSKFARLPEINPSPAHINHILTDVCELFRQGLPPHIELNLVTDNSIPQTLLDSEQMNRVFTNLIDNAIAAISHDRGRIDLISSYSKDLRIVTVDIIDNGCGITQEMVYRIFDPYVTTKKDGTGLGLAIVQQIIADHGGFIRLENNKEGGVTFSIELPA
jgi:two-component system nitrogen regulation sensor histidine kinase NtrY